ncbi:NAD-dependent epimerase/dehydratase family protein [Patescibacteria group bacterium]|nr:NAD-dependent epimerase/dehydratase family protein [Patescibacteria group bacterium]
MAHYIVTGGAGFVGSNIVHALVKKNVKVTVIDNLSTGKISNLKDIKSKITFIKGDITNLSLLMKAFKAGSLVLHQAALPSVPRSIQNPVKTAQNNEMGTLNVLTAAVKKKVKRVVYAASSSAYGEQKTAKKNEQLYPQPKSPYAISKFTGELYCQNFYEIYGLETISLRYFNVFGSYQNPDSQYAAVVPKFITAILEQKRPIIYGDGLQTRDFTHVENVIKANMLACQAPRKALGKVYNVACGQNINLNKLLIVIKKKLNSEIKPIYKASRPGDVKHSLADISLAKKYLRYKPEIDFSTGIDLTINWYKSNA